MVRNFIPIFFHRAQFELELARWTRRHWTRSGVKVKGGGHPNGSFRRSVIYTAIRAQTQAYSLAFGGILFGYDTGTISESLKTTFKSYHTQVFSGGIKVMPNFLKTFGTCPTSGAACYLKVPPSSSFISCVAATEQMIRPTTNHSWYLSYLPELSLAPS